MQSKFINITPSQSKLRLVCILISSAIIITITHHFNSYLGLLFILVYFAAGIFRLRNYSLEIDTDNNKFTLYYRNHSYPIRLIKSSQRSFLLTLITIDYANTTLPIYIDSIPLSQYKNLRMFLQWN